MKEEKVMTVLASASMVAVLVGFGFVAMADNAKSDVVEKRRIKIGLSLIAGGFFVGAGIFIKKKTSEGA